MERSPKFAADRMLGRLATWLRLIGIDTAYGPQWTGPALARVARAEQRTILTRDRRLQRVTDPPAMLFIASDDFREQLRQVLSAYGIEPLARVLSRCARCNVEVRPVPKTAALASRVPEYVFATQDRFVACPRCRRIYWPATHAARVRAELEQIGNRATDDRP